MPTDFCKKPCEITKCEIKKKHGEQAESETSYQVSVPVTLVAYAKVNHKQPAVIFITQLSIIPFS